MNFSLNLNHRRVGLPSSYWRLGSLATEPQTSIEFPRQLPCLKLRPAYPLYISAYLHFNGGLVDHLPLYGHVYDWRFEGTKCVVKLTGDSEQPDAVSSLKVSSSYPYWWWRNQLDMKTLYLKWLLQYMHERTGCTFTFYANTYFYC
jgi:hypothetical protein